MKDRLPKTIRIGETHCNAKGNANHVGVLIGSSGNQAREASCGGFRASNTTRTVGRYHPGGGG